MVIELGDDSSALAGARLVGILESQALRSAWETLQSAACLGSITVCSRTELVILLEKHCDSLRRHCCHSTRDSQQLRTQQDIRAV